MKKIIAFAALSGFVAGLAGAQAPASAQGFYKGKKVKMIVLSLIHI